MPREAVFYCDVLGFRQMAAGNADHAVDALSDLAALLQHENLLPTAKKWNHRYALGDSVFLTHADPIVAIRQASDLVFNLFQLNLGKPTAFLVRGALAYGEVQHVKGVFLTADEPANLVGHAVVEAVTLEQASGLRGPRILLSESLARGLDAGVRDWMLRPTSAAGVWEILWILPASPADVTGYEDSIAGICDTAVSLVASGGDPAFGAHYREFAMLAARSVVRLRRFAEEGRARVGKPWSSFLSAGKVRAMCEATSGLPDDYVASLLALVTSFERET
jgi:hypothetical protein